MKITSYKKSLSIVVTLMLILVAVGAQATFVSINFTIPDNKNLEDRNINLFNTKETIEKEKNNLLSKSSKGSAFYVGGVGPGNYSNIQDAIDAAGNGDTIFVFSGIYYENVYIDKSLDILGENKYTTIIDGGGSYDTVKIFVESVNISGFTIQNGHEHGILLDNTRYSNLYNLIIVNNSVEGVYSRSSFNCTIESCSISDNEYGLYTDHSTRYCSFNNNTFINNIYGGLFIKSSYNNTLKNNGISGSDVGIAIHYSPGNWVSSNNISNADDGISIKNSENNEIRYNDISNNGDGIYIHEGSINNSIVGNTIHSNTVHSINFEKILLASNNNYIYHNNFLMESSSQYAFDDCSNIWYNYSNLIIGGNYWSDFDEPSEGAWDNDSNFIIDIPYNITGGINQDKYPLSQLWTQYDPIANFTWDPMYPITNQEINFEDTSIDFHYGSIIQWYWDFGDGNTSSEQNSKHIYLDNGTYTVRLTITDDDFDTDYIEYSIQVGNVPPEADFSWTPLVPDTNELIQFTDLSIDSDGTVVSWNWDFGDGIGNSTNKNPVYSYGDNGLYTVRLTVFDNDGDSDYIEKEINVLNVPPFASFLWTPISPSTNENIQFIDTSTDSDGMVISWSWDFGDGVGYSTLRHPIYSYSDNGNYSVSLNIQDDDGATNEIEINIVISNNAPIADFSWSPIFPITVDNIQFKDQSNDSDGSVVSWLWDFGDGIGNSTIQNPTYNYISSNSYTVRLTVFDDDGSSDFIEKQIQVGNAPPKANFTLNPSSPDTNEIIQFIDLSTDSDGSVVSWLWDFGDGFGTSTIQHPTYSYNDNGAYSVNLTVTDNDGAKNSIEYIIYVTNLEPYADFTWNPSSPDTNEIIQFTDLSTDSDGSVVSWLWVFGDGFGTSTDQNPTYSYSDNGIYTIGLLVTDDDGATDYVEYNITVNNIPPVAIDDTVSTLQNTSILIDILNNDYDTDGSIDTTTVQIITNVTNGNISVMLSGKVNYIPDNGYYGFDGFTYLVYDNDGSPSNIASVNITIIEAEPPTAAFSFSPIYPTTSDIINFIDESTDDGIIVSWFWDFGDGIGNSSIQNPNYSYDDNGSYIVSLTVTDDLGAQGYIEHIVNVSNVAPVAVNDSVVSFEVSSINISVTTNDFDIDGFIDVTSILIIDDADHGNTSVDPTGIVIYSPDSGYIGTDYFTYTVDDDDGATSNIAFVFIQIQSGGFILDQEQSQTQYSFMIYGARQGGQSFIPSIDTISMIELHINKIGTPAVGITASIRDSITGSDLTSITISESAIPVTADWIEFDIPDLSVTIGNTYYIVLKTTGGSSVNCYKWSFGYNTPYTSGAFHFSSNGGTSWTQYITYDFAFKTYGPSGIVHPILSYSPSGYDFGTIIEGGIDSTSFDIWNSGTGILTYSLSESCSWLTVSPMSGISSGEHDTITVDIDTTGLSNGSYQCEVNITSNGGNGVYTIYMEVIAASPELSFTPINYDFGSMYEGVTDSTSFEIWNNGTGNLIYNINESCSWVSVNPLSGDSAGEHDLITVNIDTTGLSIGLHHCDIDISSNGGSGLFGVDIEILSEIPILGYSPSSHNFGTMYSNETDSSIFYIWNSGDGILTYSLSDTCSWVSVNPLSGTSTGEADPISINVNTAGLSPGNYHCDVLISSDGGTGTFGVDVEVLVTIPILSFSPTSFNFGKMHENETDSTTFDIWNSGEGLLTYSFTESCSWVSVTPMSGESYGEHDSITIDVDTAGLLYGTYHCDLNIYSNGGNNLFNIDLEIINYTAILSYSPTSYNLGYLFENQSYNTTFEIWNSGFSTLIYSVNESYPSININPINGTSSGEHDLITVLINTSDIAPGIYHFDIDIYSNGGSGVFGLDFQIVTQSEEIIDQKQEKSDYNFMIYGDRWAAQSFKPTLDDLSRVDLFLSKRGVPTNDVTIKIRSSLTGLDLTSLSLPITQIPSSPDWVEFDVPDISVIPGNTYYIIVNTILGSSANCPIWHFAYPSTYYNGSFFFSTNAGSNWNQYANYDFCFRTYGLGGVAVPLLYYTPNYHDFGTLYTGDNDVTTFEIWNIGTGILNYNFVESCSWVTVSPTSGQSSGEHDIIYVNINTSGLTPGSYNCEIDINSVGGSGTFEIDLELIDSTPELMFSPSSHNFGAMTQGEIDSTTFEIWNNGSGLLNYNFIESCSWLTLNPLSGNSNGEHDTITVNINTVSLTPGSYHYDININSDGGAGIFGVDVLVLAPVPILGCSSTYFNFGDILQNQTDSTSFYIWNNGNGTLTYTFSESCGWISVSPISGSSTGEADLITINIDTTGLSPGPYHCDIDISSNGGSNVFEVDVNVIELVSILSFSPSSYDFGPILQGHEDSFEFEIWNSGTGSLNYTIIESASWISVSPQTGTSYGEIDYITITVNTSGLNIGEYSHNILIQSNGGNSQFNVHLIVYVPGEVLDQEQTANNYDYLIYGDRYGAQSFKPSLNSLTKIELLINKVGNPTNNIILSVRESLTGIDIASVSLSPDSIPTSQSWIEFDFEDLAVISGQTYYVLLHTTGGSAGNCYKWRFGYQTPYVDGLFHYSTSGGVTWNDLTQYDFAFRTYSYGGPSVPILAYDLEYYDFGMMLEGQTDDTKFGIWNDGSSTLNYSFYESCSWLSLSTINGNSSGEYDLITIYVNTSGLSNGNYECDITINSNGGSGFITVYLEIVDPYPVLSFNPHYYGFGIIKEGEVHNTTFVIWNSGFSTLNYSLNESCSWVSLSSYSGSSIGEEDEIMITIDSTGLIDSLYSCNISIISNGGNNTFNVFMEVNQSGGIILDQEQDQGNYNMVIYNDRWVAQSFKPQYSTLKSVEVLIGKTGAPYGNFTLAIRHSLASNDLVNITFNYDDLPYIAEWVEFDFSDISVTIGSTYYIVAKSPENPSSTNCYHLKFGYNTPYTNGSLYISSNGGVGWGSYPYDICFRTYGI